MPECARKALSLWPKKSKRKKKKEKRKKKRKRNLDDDPKMAAPSFPTGGDRTARLLRGVDPPSASSPENRMGASAVRVGYFYFSPRTPRRRLNHSRTKDMQETINARLEALAEKLRRMETDPMRRARKRIRLSGVPIESGETLPATTFLTRLSMVEECPAEVLDGGVPKELISNPILTLLNLANHSQIPLPHAVWLLRVLYAAGKAQGTDRRPARVEWAEILAKCLKTELNKQSQATPGRRRDHNEAAWGRLSRIAVWMMEDGLVSRDHFLSQVAKLAQLSLQGRASNMRRLRLTLPLIAALLPQYELSNRHAKKVWMVAASAGEGPHARLANVISSRLRRAFGEETTNSWDLATTSTVGTPSDYHLKSAAEAEVVRAAREICQHGDAGSPSPRRLPDILRLYLEKALGELVRTGNVDRETLKPLVTARGGVNAIMSWVTKGAGAEAGAGGVAAAIAAIATARPPWRAMQAEILNFWTSFDQTSAKDTFERVCAVMSALARWKLFSPGLLARTLLARGVSGCCRSNGMKPVAILFPFDSTDTQTTKTNTLRTQALPKTLLAVTAAVTPASEAAAADRRVLLYGVSGGGFETALLRSAWEALLACFAPPLGTLGTARAAAAASTAASTAATAPNAYQSALKSAHEAAATACACGDTKVNSSESGYALSTAAKSLLMAIPPRVRAAVALRLASRLCRMAGSGGTTQALSSNEYNATVLAQNVAGILHALSMSDAAIRLACTLLRYAARRQGAALVALASAGANVLRHRPVVSAMQCSPWHDELVGACAAIARVWPLPGGAKDWFELLNIPKP